MLKLQYLSACMLHMRHVHAAAAAMPWLSHATRPLTRCQVIVPRSPCTRAWFVTATSARPNRALRSSLVAVSLAHAEVHAYLCLCVSSARVIARRSPHERAPVAPGRCIAAHALTARQTRARAPPGRSIIAGTTAANGPGAYRWQVLAAEVRIFLSFNPGQKCGDACRYRVP